MKTLITTLAVATLLAAGALAYAHGPGYGGWSGGHMMGPMTGWGSTGTGADKKFFDETADLRKELHEKRFEYFEASRGPYPDKEQLTNLEKEIYDLQTKIREKSPRTAYGGYGGYGRCW